MFFMIKRLAIILMLLTAIIVSGCSNAREVKPSDPTVYPSSETGIVGGMAYTIGEITEVYELGGKETDGKFVLVEITAKNIGNEPAGVYEYNFIVIDAEGRQFKNYGLYVEFGMERFSDTLNPGMSKTAQVAFEMPADAEVIAVAARDTTLGRQDSGVIVFDLTIE